MALSWMTRRGTMREQRHRAVRDGPQHASSTPGKLTNLLSSYTPHGGKSSPCIHLRFVLAQGTQEPGDARSTDRSFKGLRLLFSAAFCPFMHFTFQNTPFLGRKVPQALFHAHSLSRVVSPWPQHALCHHVLHQIKQCLTSQLDTKEPTLGA